MYYLILNYWAPDYMVRLLTGYLWYIVHDLHSNPEATSLLYFIRYWNWYSEKWCSQSHTQKVAKPDVDFRPSLPDSKTCAQSLTHKDIVQVVRVKALDLWAVLCHRQVQGICLSWVFSPIRFQITLDAL